MRNVKSLRDKSAGLYTRPKPSTIIILYRYSICIR